MQLARLDNMTDRIRRLRQDSLDAAPRLSPERARLLTEFYRGGTASNQPLPVLRALAFRHLLLHKELCLTPGELIVGERGPAPKAVPTYPELCVHTLEDFDILNTREKIPYAVDDEMRRVHAEDVAPFWEGCSMRESIMEEMSPEWHAAYEAGIFTEFMEQRSPGHTVLGGTIYGKGMLDLQAEVRVALDQLDFEHDPEALDRRDELRAMSVAAQAIIDYATRYADLLDARAEQERDAGRRAELLQMASNCRQVPAHAPETFWQALQYYWFVHVGVISEMNPWDSFNPGRLDQHLHPFYQRETEAGDLDEASARELLQSFWIKFHNHPAPPKVGVTAQESGTYTDFALINVGGVRRDGSNAVNELSYLILDVIQDMRLLQPSSMVQLSKKNPDRFIRHALRIVQTGFGQPSIFNTDAIVQELMRQGKAVEDARDGGASGCVEAGAFGREAYILTGYFNIPKVLELTLHNGVDPRTGKPLGPETGDPRAFATFDELYEAFDRQLRHFVDIKVRGNNIIDRLFARRMPAPFLSLLIEDCIANGRDYHAGGARYNTSYIQGVGLGSITDALSAIQHHVYDQQDVTMDDLMTGLTRDFEGDDALHALLTDDTPRYGNDDDRADDLTRRVFESYFAAVDGRPNARGGTHHVDLLPTTCHVYFGSVCGALPDGRRAGKPLSEGISPVQGADRHGPTAVVKSAAKLDHLRTGGTLLNQKFSPHLFSDEDGRSKVAHLIRSYFRMDGHHIQFNVIDAATLREAQRDPGAHRDLIVRVAGYSDYFVDLTEDLQNEIILRTEHAES